jgi:hypothetical protein
MNETELLQLMIVNAVKEGVDKALKPLQEEIAKVKQLTARVLKEQTEFKTQFNQQLIEASNTPAFRKIGPPSAPTILESNQPVYNSNAYQGRSLDSFKAEAAAFVHADEVLPDIDIPIELFLKRN